MKKLCKKFFAIVLATMMMVSSVVVNVSAETTPTIAASKVTGQVGETVDVVISLENNPGFVSMMLDVEYDSTALKLMGINDPGLIGGSEHSSDYTLNPYRLTWSNDTAPSNIMVNGNIVTLTFEILETAVSGEYEIAVTYDYDDYFIYDYDVELVLFNLVNGSVTVLSSCNHNYAINRYNGLMTCSVCNEVCPHDVWTSSVCEACGLECTHDWSYSGTTATCGVCGATCTSHAKQGLFLDCATCGYDMELANSYYKGDSQIADTGLTLQTAHGFKLNTQLTVGSAETIFNIKDTARNDNVYYSAVENANGSDYFSLITWIYTLDGVSDPTYKSLVSLWLDTTDEFSSKVNGEVPDNFAASKLWLTAPNNSSQKICEIKAGETYDLTVYYEVKWAWSLIEVRQNGELIASYTANGDDFSGTLTSSKIILGESATAKKIHIQKISFEDVIFSDTYEKGVCRLCGAECAHRYNVGGYCADCGVLGDPITYSDKTGSSAFSIGGSNIGAYKSSNTSTVGIWRIFDETEMLLGHDYVMDMDVKFTEAFCDSSITNTGTTSRFAIWADADVETTTSNTKFGIFIRTLADNDQVVLLGFRDDFKVSDPHMTFNLNEKHNLRIAIRSNPTATAGTYDHTAEVYLDGKLVYTQAFTLTAENGMAVSVGDHTRRICCARSEIDSTFGIHFLDDTVEYIGAQEKENADYSADEKFDIRFVFGFDDLYLEDVGVKVEASVSDGTKGEKVLAANNVALTAISVNGVEKQVGVNGIGYGGYYMATAIKDIDLDLANTYTFKLTPYIEKQYASEVTYMPYSYEITVSFDSNAKMVIDYNKIG